LFKQWLEDVDFNVMVVIADKKIKTISRTYADVKEGKLLAYIGSSGYLEIGIRNGNAAKTLNAHLGMEIQINKF
jgi:S-adenosylmethionine hydrolase